VLLLWDDLSLQVLPPPTSQRSQVTNARGEVGRENIASRFVRHVPLELLSVERFEDGLVQLHCSVQNQQ
jgi:hypothetical protein